jgi:hypothetical protein
MKLIEHRDAALSPHGASRPHPRGRYASWPNICSASARRSVAMNSIIQSTRLGGHTETAVLVAAAASRASTHRRSVRTDTWPLGRVANAARRAWARTPRSGRPCPRRRNHFRATRAPSAATANRAYGLRSRLTSNDRLILAVKIRSHRSSQTRALFTGQPKSSGCPYCLTIGQLEAGRLASWRQGGEIAEKSA